MAKQVAELLQRLEKEKSITANHVQARATAQGNGTSEDDVWEDLDNDDEDMS
jgi:hypothetical protein